MYRFLSALQFWPSKLLLLASGSFFAYGIILMKRPYIFILHGQFNVARLDPECI
jgi:hypothetical protein